MFLLNEWFDAALATWQLSSTYMSYMENFLNDWYRLSCWDSWSSSYRWAFTNCTSLTLLSTFSMFEPPYPAYDPTDTSGYVLKFVYALTNSSLIYDSRFSWVISTNLNVPILFSRTCLHPRYETVLKRWPSILTGIVNQVYKVNHDLTLRLCTQCEEERSSRLGEQILKPEVIEEFKEKIEEGKKIIEKVSFLKYAMARDQVMECVFISSSTPLVFSPSIPPTYPCVFFSFNILILIFAFQTTCKWLRATYRDL